jgi:hypothetical protein
MQFNVQIFRRLWKLKFKSKCEFSFTSSIAMAEIRIGNLGNGKLIAFLLHQRQIIIFFTVRQDFTVFEMLEFFDILKHSRFRLFRILSFSRFWKINKKNSHNWRSNKQIMFCILDQTFYFKLVKLNIRFCEKWWRTRNTEQNKIIFFLIIIM